MHIELWSVTNINECECVHCTCTLSLYIYPLACVRNVKPRARQQCNSFSFVCKCDGKTPTFPSILFVVFMIILSFNFQLRMVTELHRIWDNISTICLNHFAPESVAQKRYRQNELPQNSCLIIN